VTTPSALRALLLLLLAALCSAATWGAPANRGAAAGAPSSAAEPKEDPRKPYALIFGTVWGPDARPVQGVKIKVRRAQEKKARWEMYSDRRGEFAVRLPAGKQEYVVWADVKGPKDRPKPEVRVQIENDERADIGLHLTE
jgi:hypothetical protein